MGVVAASFAEIVGSSYLQITPSADVFPRERD